jgi:AraC family transcriptional regulator
MQVLVRYTDYLEYINHVTIQHVDANTHLLARHACTYIYNRGHIMPTKQITRNEYQQRVQKVIDHIYDNLDKDLSLEQLSTVACFSPYHWLRIYQSICGESTKDTVRRLRLQRAAKALIDTDVDIHKIARQAGYENTDSFTRKFSAAFDIPPNAYRKRGKLIVEEIDKPSADTSDRYEVTIEAIDNLSFACMQHQGNYLEIGRVFEKLFAWGAHNNLLNAQTRCFGIYHDDPGMIAEENLRSKACLTVQGEFEETDEVKRFNIPSAKYARIIHKGPYSELETAYKWLYTNWLVNSGEEPDDRPGAFSFEEYLNNPREVEPSELLTVICLPLK